MKGEGPMPESDIPFRASWSTDNTDGSDGSAVLVCRPGGEVLIADNAPVFPLHPFFPDRVLPEWEALTIGFHGESPVILAMAPADAPAPIGYEWRSPRTLLAGLTPAMVEALSRASMLASWDHDHRFCGRCGSETFRDDRETARVCPSCGHRSYPRLSPAMIVLIEATADMGFDEPRILLAHNRRFPEGVYSCLAGYVEAGETLEATVRREVMEEVGLEVDSPVYVRSQAWPLPHSLMLGFRAVGAGNPRPDGDEITDARWFSAADLPHIPRHGTIARTLIDDWLERIGATTDRA